MPEEILVQCENISKKFCSDLKRSLWYGVKDVCSELNPFLTDQSKRADEYGRLPVLREKEFWAIKKISFELKRGECLGLIGHNGAGKSTLLKLLNGLIKPDHGQVVIRGRIGSLIELNVGFNPVLTGRENVYIYGSILGFSKHDIDKKYSKIVEFSELEEFMEMPFRSYSSGMKVRLGFAVAAQMEPDVLIIDEVLAVGDVGFRAKCYDFISSLMEKTAIIFVSHSMPEIDRICNKIMFIDKKESEYYGYNISKGIDLYYSSFNKPSGTMIKTPNGEFTKIRINGQESNECQIIKFNEDILFQIYAKISPSEKNPVFHIALLNQSLQNICHCSSAYSQEKFEIKDGMIKLEVLIPKINVRPGIYYIDFAITDEMNVKIIARTHLNHRIQVAGNFTGYGVTLFQGDWKLLN